MTNLLLKIVKGSLRMMLFAIFIACHQRQGKTNQEAHVDRPKQASVEIPFTLAKNYFVRNDFDASSLLTPKITTQEDFEKIFGMATVMGKEGKPTPLDFSKQFVIAIILPISNTSIELKVQQLQLEHDQITLRYKQSEGASHTMQTQAFLLLVLDKKYDHKVVVEQLK